MPPKDAQQDPQLPSANVESTNSKGIRTSSSQGAYFPDASGILHTTTKNELSFSETWGECDGVTLTRTTKNSKGDALRRSVMTDCNSVTISHQEDKQQYDHRNTLGIDSEKVAKAIEGAIQRAFKDKIVSPVEAAQLDKLRQYVAKFGANDGKFDPAEIRALVKRANKIAPEQTL